MELNRKQKRERERKFNKIVHLMVCIWCGTGSNNCDVTSVEKTFCYTCNDETRLVMKSHFKQLNQGYN